MVHDYDLSSAFPNVAKDLIDIRDCKWIQDKAYIMGAVYGFVKCEVTIYDWVKVSPIIKDTDEALISPTGTWETCLTKDELDFIMKWGIGEFKILDGWWAVTTRKAFRKPLLAPMEKLLKYKQGTELQRLLAKRMSTGIYGKMGEERAEEFGPYFNSVWFSVISTRTRLEVADFLYSHDIGPGDNEGYRTLLAIGVDGFMVSEPLVATTGQWKLAYEGPVLIVSSGLVYTNLTKPKGLKLPEVLAMIKEHPHRNYYERTLRRRLTLGDALAQDRLEDIGKEMDFSVSLSLLGANHDRHFSKLPQTGQQLLSKKYRSEPIKV
jgi:hypothetical protein